MDQDAINTLLSGASKLLEQQEDSGYKIHNQFREQYGDLLTAHILSVGVIGTALNRKEGESTEIGDDFQQQIVLISSFIQGITIVDSSISEGYYTQATALLRQELETIIALENLKNNKAVAKNMSNVVHVPWSLAWLFGDLSNETHNLVHSKLQAMLQDTLSPDSAEIQEDTTRVITIPIFNETMSWRLFGLHVVLLILIAMHLHEHLEAVYGEGQGLNETELQAMINAQKILLDCGWLDLES